MINYFHLLVDKKHFIRTAILFILSIVLISIAIIIKVDSNLPGLILLFAGMIALIVTFIHVSRDALSYYILAAVSVAIVIIAWFGIRIYETQTTPVTQSLYNQVIDNSMLILTFCICLPGIIVGIAGGIHWSIKEKKKDKSYLNKSKFK